MMSTPTFLEPNPNLNFTPFSSNTIQDYDSYFQDLDFLGADDINHLSHDLITSNNNTNINTFASTSTISQTSFIMPEKSNNSTTGSSSGCSFDGMPTSNYHMQVKCKREKKGPKMKEKHAIAFRTKTDLEVLDDGYKWRKYGKKKIKNNSHLRNYYKCSNGGCGVKKKIERDEEDSKYLITTYEGVHNHESLYLIHYQDLPQSLPYSGFTLLASHPY